MASLEPVLEKVGKILTDQYGIRIVCEGQRCATDGRVIYLPALPDDVPEELWRTIRGFVDHESAHLIFHSNFQVGNDFRRKYGNDAFGLLNILEDLRVERAMMERFPGSGANLDHAYRSAETSALELAGQGKPLPLMRHLAFAVAARGAGRPAPDFVDPTVTQLAGQIDNEILQSITAPNTKVVAKLAESAWAVVKPFLQSASFPVSDPRQDPRQGPQHGEPRSGAGQNSRSGPSSAEGASGASGSKSGALKHRGRKAPRSNVPAPPAISQEDASSSNAGNGPADATAGAGVSGSDVESGIIGGLGQELAQAVGRHADTVGAYRVWSTAADTVTVVSDQTSRSHAERMAPLMRHVAGVRQRLLQTLLAESRARWLPDQDTGRLNPKALHRLAAAHWAAPASMDASAMTRNIFRRRVVAQRLKTAVTLLIDQSHSMNGRKIELAKNTALVLCESLARLSIPTEVIGFSTKHASQNLKEAVRQTGLPAATLEERYRFAPLIHEIVMRFGESFRQAAGRFDDVHTHMLTPLGESMLFAARRLAVRPEPRKILLVLTDGRPTVGMGQDFATFRHAKESIVRIERAGIGVMLFGMVERCVLDLHRRAVVVNDLDDLPRTVMAQVRKLLSDPAAVRQPS